MGEGHETRERQPLEATVTMRQRQGRHDLTDMDAEFPDKLGPFLLPRDPGLPPGSSCCRMVLPPPGVSLAGVNQGLRGRFEVAAPL